MALNVKVSFLGFLDMLKFKNMAKARNQAIDSASENKIITKYAINENAKTLHPDYQKLELESIEEFNTAGAKRFVFKSEDNSKIANFRAGQYLSLKLKIGESYVTRPYSICSSPKEATRDGKIAITIKTNPDGFAADWLLDNVKVGDVLVASDPQGQFYYEDLRDKKDVVALAGGSGITPFLSMAKAIVEGSEDFNLTIIYGCRKLDQIIFKDELEDLAKHSDGKVKVVYILSDERVDGYENGFITSDVIKKYAPANEEYSIFICGPEAMYKFAEQEIKSLNLPRRLVRNELLGVPKNIALDEKFNGDINATYSVTVKQTGKPDCVIDAKSVEPLLVAFERAGIKAPSRCRSGECGWCRSKLVSGDVYVVEATDGRRAADKKSNTIHPCASYPLSDCVVEVPGEYWA